MERTIFILECDTSSEKSMSKDNYIEEINDTEKEMQVVISNDISANNTAQQK